MSIDTKVLDILFRQVPPEEILERLYCENGLSLDMSTDPGKVWFRRFARDVLRGYSEDELDMLYKELAHRGARQAASISPGVHSDCRLDFVELVFLLLQMQAEKMLCLHQQEPRCQIREVLHWRELFLYLGQDLPICAYLSGEDLKSQYHRRQFVWPAIVRADHALLNTMLEEGLAENHQHLFGSSQTFALTWMDLMNFPEDHYQILAYIRLLRQKVSVDRAAPELLSLPEKVRLASFLRICLFNNVCGDWDQQTTSEALRKGLKELPFPESLNANIAFARSQWGAQVPQPDGGEDVLDYALTRDIFQKSEDAPYRSLGGERQFLYRCFLFFYKGKLTGLRLWCFYLYLLLKLQFRSEIIQVNDCVGFENFSVYQKRKTKLNAHLFAYNAELIRMALAAPRQIENVASLETRISPCASARENREYIIDRIEADRIFAEPPRGNTALSARGEVFYVFHFIKSKDEATERGDVFSEDCRHAKKRKEVRRQAAALAEALKKYPDLRDKVRGIDSASNEIGCPPEVFANAYRFLRNLPASGEYAPLFSSPVPIRLSETYHVGEDFLDIASALRAIDEAVNFLELDRGDRIGHGLGLGVLPSVHYKLKNFRVHLPKQERLDDVVWLLYRGQELGVQIEPEVRSRLQKEAEKLLMEIYRPVFEKGIHITLTDYHCIMQLRADDPSCYKTGRFAPPSPFCSSYEEFGISSRDDARNAYRENPIFSEIYAAYHFNREVKQRGWDVCAVEIDAPYMELIRQMQDKLQAFLQEKGIVVECNPSSNVLIGTFRDYSAHPVFRFHPVIRGAQGSTANEMQVCINTDDLGVFDTSLEFEYTLLFQTLCECRSPDGGKAFRESEILEYLERLRQMGNGAVFPKIVKPGTKGSAF